MRTLYRGTFVHALSGDAMTPQGPGTCPLEVLGPRAIVAVDAQGVIETICTDPAQAETLWAAADPLHRVDVPDNAIVVPGFIDLHCHAPQFQYTGTATDKPLMEWLEAYTFPAERRMEDVGFACRSYTDLVGTLLAHGTTTCVYFGTIHTPATLELAKVCLKKGQRAIVGKVNMDRNAPDTYVDASLEDSVAGTRALIDGVYNGMQPGVSAPLVDVAITPRFLPTCSPSLLKALGDVWDSYGADAIAQGLAMQTHVSESVDEVAYCAALHPEEPRDLPHFVRANLIRPRSILAHCVYLSDDELRVVEEKGAAIACCPLSNFFFAGGQLDVARAVGDFGVRVGLATDVAGGYSPSMLNACRSAVLGAKALDAVDNASAGLGSKDLAPSATAQGSVRPFDFRHAFWLATAGGARSLHRSHQIGRFAVGMDFDAVVVTPPPPALGAVELGHGDTSAARNAVRSLERWVNLGDDRHTQRVFVRGRCIYEGQ